MADYNIVEILNKELEEVRGLYQETLKAYKPARAARNAAWTRVMELEDGKSYDGYSDDLTKAYNEYETAGATIEQLDEELERFEDMMYHLKGLLEHY